MNELTQKESIRLGQAMNIVGHKYEDFTNPLQQSSFKVEVLELYRVLTEVEAEVLAKKNEKKAMSFPTGDTRK
jgi:hypothetical protein